MSNKRLFSEESYSYVKRNIKKFERLVAFWRFYPDLMLDTIAPATNALSLDLDQRVYLRALVRTKGLAAVYPRGYGKTFIEVLASFCVCLLYPGISISITAQTKENAAVILGEKVVEVMNFFPALQKDVVKIIRSKNSAKVEFKNGSWLDILANSQTSKGQRRTRINVEEFNLVDEDLFLDAMEPIVEVPRRTKGKLSLVDPAEANFQINFLSTAGRKGTKPHERFLNMIDQMAENNGTYVLSSDYKLSTYYGRGTPLNKMKERFKTLPRTIFNMNYKSRWVGNVEGSLIPYHQIERSRTLQESIVENSESLMGREFYIGVDVARSERRENDRTAITVVEVKRNSSGRIVKYELPYITSIPNTWEFTKQAAIIKKTQSIFNSKVIVVDGNSIGAGMIDALMLEQTYEGVIYPPYGVRNEHKSAELPNAIKLIYELKAGSNNSDIIGNVIHLFEQDVISILEPIKEEEYVEITERSLFNQLIPKSQTEELVVEIMNLKLKIDPKTKRLSVEQQDKKIRKDRFSSFAYVLWYIKNFALETGQVSLYNVNKELYTMMAEEQKKNNRQYSPFGNRTDRNPFNGGGRNIFGRRI